MRFLPVDLLSTATLFALSTKDKQQLSRHSFLPLSESQQIEATAKYDTDVTHTPLANNKYDRLLAWLQSNDSSFVNKNIVLKPSEKGGGYGAFVVNNKRLMEEVDSIDGPGAKPLIDANEVLFTIPRSLCITVGDAINDKDYGKEFQKLIEKAGPGGNTVVLSGFMAVEWLKCVESGVIEESIFGPYLDTLPWSRGVNSQEHILYWDDSEIEETLRGSMCYGEALDLRKEVKLAIKVLNNIVSRIQQAKNENVSIESFRWPWEKVEAVPVRAVEGLADAITGAFVSVLTRSFEDAFGDDNTDQEKMVPLLDMLQHSDNPNVSHSMRTIDGAVEVRAKKPLYDGDELLNQYRSELEVNMPYHRFFTRFGFVPGITEPVENLFTDKSSIFFSKKAEV